MLYHGSGSTRRNSHEAAGNQQQEFCAHIEDDDFLLRYGNPVAVMGNDGRVLICMAIAYYERMTGKKIELKSEET